MDLATEKGWQGRGGIVGSAGFYVLSGQSSGVPQGVMGACLEGKWHAKQGERLTIVESDTAVE